MPNKDELLQQIVNLESSLEQTRTEWTKQNSEVESLQNMKDSVEKLYNEYRKQFKAAEERWSDAKSDLGAIRRKGDTDKAKLAALQRELQRIISADEINAELIRTIEEFRNKCLEAPWRAENREDGLGALTHQIDGAINAAVAGQVLLGDKRGLGKTLTSLIWLDLRESQRVIVVCPSDTMDNFIREIKMWTPHRNVLKLGGTAKNVRDAVLSSLQFFDQYVLVINYEAWRMDSELVPAIIKLKADTLVMDEAHRAKNVESLTCRGVMQIRFGLNMCPECKADDPRITQANKYDERKCIECGYEGFITDFCSIKSVMPMTGTPILNRPQELYPQLRMIDPVNFQTENVFLRDFCVKGYDQHWTWQYGSEKKLIEKIGPRYIARDRMSAGIVIPPAKPIHHIIPFAMMESAYPDQAKAYRQARDYAQLVLNPFTETTMSMVAKISVLLRLRQVLVWPNAIKLEHRDPDTDDILFSENLDVHESVKLDKAEELIREIVEEGDRVVLFSQFKPGLHELQRRLGSMACVYDGDTNRFMRNQIQLDFDPKTVPDKPRWAVALCNYKAAGEGLNMNAASHLIKLDREWSPGREDQAEGRIDRIGTVEAATIHTISVENTVDAWMESLIEQKRSMIAGFQGEADVYRNAYDALLNGDM